MQCIHITIAHNVAIRHSGQYHALIVSKRHQIRVLVDCSCESAKKGQQRDTRAMIEREFYTIYLVILTESLLCE
jgi:hypothetical protein